MSRRFVFSKDGALLVTEEMVGVHPKHPTYPLLPDDVLTRGKDWTWVKHTGLGISGFVLSKAQEATLKPAERDMVMEMDNL